MPFPYWSIKPWFLTEGKLAAVLITCFLLGFPTVQPTLSHSHINSTSTRLSGAVAHIKIFWRRCRGEISLLQGESLTLNLFYFVIVFCFPILFAALYQKSKKNSLLFIVVIFVVCYLLYHASYQWLISLELDLIGKVDSWKNNKNIMRNTACHKKGNTYGHNYIN